MSDEPRELPPNEEEQPAYEGLFANRSRAVTSDTDAERARGQASSRSARSPAAPWVASISSTCS